MSKTGWSCSSCRVSVISAPILDILRPIYTVGYRMVLSKSHGMSAVYMRSPTDFLWDLLSTMGYPMGHPMGYPTV
jgi:hypothetical protein